ncbi:MAG: hypothetical protein V4724_20130 [Pseudomonadota bacterium]
MTPRQWAMGAALAGAAALLVFGDRTPSGDVAEAVERRAPPAAAPATAPATAAATAAPRAAARNDKAAVVNDTMIARLTPRALLVGESGDATFAGTDGVFSGQNWNPPPPARPPAPPPPPPPSAPALPFTYLGKAAADGAWEVFLARSDRTYVVRNGAVIDGVYRVDEIAPPMLTLTYLPLNQVQRLNIGVSD